MRNLQLADECDCRDILIAVGNFGQLALKATDIGFEVVALPLFDGEKIAIVPLSFPIRGVLSEKWFDYLLEVIERMW